MTWNKICYLKCLKLETFKQVMGVGYLKLSDKTWNEMCYLKLFKLFNPSQELVIWNFQIRHESCLFETFRWDLKQDILFDMFETWNFSNMAWELLIWNFQTCHGGFFIWNFQMRLEMRCAIWNFSTFSNPSQELLILNFQMTWNKICYLKCLKLETFQTCHGGLLIWNFQIRLEVRCAIWNFSKFSTHHRSWLFETFRWLEVRCAIWNFSNFSTHHRSWLFETFR